MMDQKNKVDWLLLPLELWDYVFRHHVVDEYDALRLAQTCVTLWEVYKSNGVKEWAWHNRWTGEVEEWYEFYENNWKGPRRLSNFKKEGVWRTLHENGQPSCETHWMNGKEHGLSRGWYENGQLRWENHRVNGELHGLERIWHVTGQLYWENHWASGELHGLERWWDTNGVMIDEKNWVHGVVEDE